MSRGFTGSLAAENTEDAGAQKVLGEVSSPYNSGGPFYSAP